MSTVPSVDIQGAQSSPERAAVGHETGAPFAVCLPPMPHDELRSMVQRLHQIADGEPLLIASPDHGEATVENGIRIVPYPAPRTGSEWVLRAADYATAARVASEYGSTGLMLLGSDAASITQQTMLNLRLALHSNVDLAVPRYRTNPSEGLVNSALLYPLTRALFGADIRFPLPLDAAMSPRMLNRLASAAMRVGAQLDDSLVWPVSEAAVAGFTVRQSDGGERTLPRPQETDLNVLFPAVTSMLFTDLEHKATFWQRARTVPGPRVFTPSAAHPDGEGAEEIRSLVEGFRLAFSNLREIWSLVLPPQSLLSLKKLSVTPAETFSFPPALWARVVYDFALAFHLRTLNRGHLLGALTPLYLAWVASLLREVSGPAGAEPLLESTASAFEAEKPYLVSRWRWPDRFNP